MRLKLQENDKNIVINIVGAYLIRGGALLLSLFSTPAYIKYFDNNAALGVWYTMLSILTWVMMFDLGIGNGLRNKLSIALSEKREDDICEYISSSYVSILIIVIGLGAFYFICQSLLNWNSILNINSNQIDPKVLQLSMSIIICGVLIRFVFGLINSIIYALQKSMLNNLLAFITNLLIFIYILIAPKSSVEKNLISLSIVHVFLSNIPLIVASLIVFKKYLPNVKIRACYFKLQKAKEVIETGTVLLWLQIVAMVVLSTHPILISNIRSPEDVVEYNIYYKVFGTLASLITLALTPIWSAVTKAKTENNYLWIKKIYRMTMLLPALIAAIDIFLSFILQGFFDIWLRDSTITVDNRIVIAMCIFNITFVLHQVNTNINNGLEEFKIQTILMTLAALLMIPLSFLLCNALNSWTGVVLACSTSILPYCIIQPFAASKYLERGAKKQ